MVVFWLKFVVPVMIVFDSGVLARSKLTVPVRTGS